MLDVDALLVDVEVGADVVVLDVASSLGLLRSIALSASSEKSSARRAPGLSSSAGRLPICGPACIQRNKDIRVQMLIRNIVTLDAKKGLWYGQVDGQEKTGVQVRYG